MSIAFVANRGTINSGTFGTSEPADLPAGASIAVGNVLFATIATDNSAFDGTQNVLGITDPRGNLWRRLGYALNDPGSENLGVQLDVWMTYVQFAYVNGDDLTITAFEPIVAGCATILEFSGVKPVLNYITKSENLGVGTTASTAGISPGLAGRLVLSATGIDFFTTVTGDADTTDGSWSSTIQVANSSGFAGVTLATQYKIVTGTSTQNWAATYPNSAEFAAVTVVLDLFTASANPQTNGNPDYPCPAGFEGLPTGNSYTAVDTGTLYTYAHQVMPDANGSREYTVTTEFQIPTENCAHTVVYELWDVTNEELLVPDEITTTFCPVLSVSATTGVVSGGSNVAEALNFVGGNNVLLDDSDTITLYFEGFSIPDGARVVNVRLQYIAWKDDSSPASPSEGFKVDWLDNTLSPFGSPTSETIAAWLTPDYQSTSQLVIRSIGEMNPLATVIPNDSYGRVRPWTNEELRIWAPSYENALVLTGLAGDNPEAPLTGTVTFDYVQLIVDTVPERRIGMTGRVVSNVGFYSSVDAITMFGPDYTIRMLTRLGTTFTATASTPYLLTVREATNPSSSDYYRVNTELDGQQFAKCEPIGPSLQILGVTVPRDTMSPSPTMSVAVVSDGVISSTPELVTDRLTSVAAFDAAAYAVEGSFFPGWKSMAPVTSLQVDSSGSKSRYIKVPGGQQYDRIKVVVRPDPAATEDMVITAEKPSLTVLATATLTVADARNGTYLGGGWYEVIVPFNVAFTPTSGQLLQRYSCSGGTYPEWYVSAAISAATKYSFGYNPVGDPNSSSTDLTGVLLCTPTAPSLSISTANRTVSRPGCTGSTLRMPNLAISNFASYDRFIVHRSITAGHSDAYVIYNGVAISDFDDISVPWDVTPVYYRVTGYNDVDRRPVDGSWVSYGTVATSPSAAWGLSDFLTDEAVAYAPVDSSDLFIEWEDLTPTVFAQLHDQNYQIQVQSAEDRGLSTSVTLLLDNMFTCDNQAVTSYDQTIVPGAKAMTPSPYNILRAMKRAPRLGLQLPGGFFMWVGLSLGGMKIRTSSAVYMAEVTITQVQGPTDDPYDGSNGLPIYNNL